MYKKDKSVFVSNCFLKVKMLDFSTTTYDDLLENSQYKETLEETRRLQNISQSLTNIKDTILEFFIELDGVRLKIQTENKFHVEGSNILNFVHTELLQNTMLFRKFKLLLDDFDINDTHVRLDEELRVSALKELYEDIIWRFCRVENNQFRKDLIRSLRKEQSDTL